MNECYWCGTATDDLCCDECVEPEARQIRDNAQAVAHRFSGVPQ